MSDYLLQHGNRVTPQSEPIREDQVANSAGGFTWAVDPFTRLRRFLILGSEGGSYYASERDLTRQNVGAIRDCLKLDGRRVVDEIVAVSTGGLAPKNDPALYALACAISADDADVRRAASFALPSVARTGTHLFHFVAYAETMRGWGRTLRRAVTGWYQQNPDQLALQAVKYRQRDGWSHRDLLRLAHPESEENASIFDWIAHGREAPLPRPSSADAIRLIGGFELAQDADTPADTAALIRGYRLPREAVKPEHLNDPDVWRALLDVDMPMTALIRNLGNMTRHDVLTGDYLATVIAKLGDDEAIRRARVHPIQFLLALATYAHGEGFRGSNTWQPIPSVVDALDRGFYKAFQNVEPTGKRILLALDISGSMGMGQVAGTPLTPREAAAAMAMVTVATEPDVRTVAFAFGGDAWPDARLTTQFGIQPIGLSSRQRLDDVVRFTASLKMGGTDCALPMLYALDKCISVDAFVIYTDSETWAGTIHPVQALRQYRDRTGIPARLVVVGMVSSGFTIADPNDAGMLDVIGFDSSAPRLISEFAAGRL